MSVRNRSTGAYNNSALGAAYLARFLFALLLIAAPFATLPVKAQATQSYAGIVIRPGDGTVIYAYVPTDEPVSGIELLRRSGISLVTVGFGGLGEGVCKIEETGCDVGPCRSRLCQTGDRNSPYWRYFQLNQNGDWVAAPLGGSSTRVAPGEVNGWSWTPDEPLLPDVQITAIPTLAGAESDPGNAHYAHYDANGKLVEQSTMVILEKRSYIPVIAILAAVAGLGLALRLRPRRAA